MAALFLSAALAISACGSNDPPVFDADNAFDLLEQQCGIGPRFPGSPEHRMLQRYLASSLERYGANLSLQPFEGILSSGDTLRLVNIIGNYNMKSGKRIMLGAHYDTRPVADMDPDPANRDIPITGANDGASGVAVLLEIARLLGEHPPPVGVDIILFDGEDYGEAGKAEDFCLGSAYFASNTRGYMPFAAIVIDMIGDSDLVIRQEGFSRAAAPDLYEEIFAIADELGLRQFRREKGQMIIDDHLPLIQAGFRAVDLIDFDYDHWHTLEDTPDKCSRESLDAVGRVLIEFIWRQK
ncbi:MAG: M28 family peptidase [Candidatus Krumholzibacteriota bacterium]|nr:M28 family peptidase [Candidatus Krumholzibacteriota bacterium]